MRPSSQVIDIEDYRYEKDEFMRVGRDLDQYRQDVTVDIEYKSQLR